VGEAAEMLKAAWREVDFIVNEMPDAPHEAVLLHLNCTKAEKELNWHGVLSPAEMFDLTAGWYREFYSGNRVITAGQIAEYETLAEERNPVWTE
jgi:CDP-glucose 4,6-dehydratase